MRFDMGGVDHQPFEIRLFDEFCDGTTQHDDATLAAPGFELQSALDSRKALACVLPRTALALLQQLDEAFDLGALPQLEEILLPTLLARVHELLLAIGQVTTNERGALRSGQLINQSPEGRRTVLGRAWIARLHFHIQTHAQSADEVTVIGRLGRPGLAGLYPCFAASWWP